MIRNFYDNRLVGRDKEIQLIKNGYSRILAGEMAIICVVGAPGIGKTHLYKCAFDKIGTKTLVSIKFTQDSENFQRSTTELIGQIADYLLMLPREALDNITRNANQNMAENIALLASICPKLSNLMGASKPLNFKDYERLKYRIKNAICTLIDIASSYLYPLILFFDDVQWADSFSLNIIRTLINKNFNLMLGLSYRENGNCNMQRLLDLLESKSAIIDLQPLSKPDVKQYLSLLFEDEIEHIDNLSSIIYSLTLGNPFYLKEIVTKLLHEAIIKYSKAEKRWEVDIPDISRVIISHDIERIIRDKISKSESRDLLELISCLDGKADYELLKLLYEKNDFNTHLKKNLEAAIVMKHKERDGRTSIRFLHDIIYKMVDGCMSACQKQSIHYKITEKVLSDWTISIENRTIFITSHLIRASKQVAFENADKWINILFDAGMQEKKQASLDTALSIFEFCNDMLFFAKHNESFTVTVQLELAECLCLAKRYKESQELIDTLMQKKRERPQMLVIKVKQLYLYHYQREHQSTLQTGREILKMLGFSFGKYRLPLDLIKCRLVYSKNKIASLANMPEQTDERAGIIIDTLGIMNSSAALVSDDTLAASIGLSAALVGAKYGDAANTLNGLVSYAFVLYTVWKDFKKTKLFVNKIIQISEMTANQSSNSMVYFIIGAFLSHWCDPMGQADRFLHKSIEYGELTGDFLFLGYSISTSLDVKNFMGKGYDKQLKFIEKCKLKYSETFQPETTYNLEAYTNHINSLMHGDDTCDFDKIGRNFPMLTPFEKLTEKMLMLERLLLQGNLAQGYELVKIVAPLMNSNKGLICRVSTVFFSLLISAGADKVLDKAEQLRNRMRIGRLLKELRYWACLQEENFYGHYALALAEYEFLMHNRLSDLYNKAADHAHKHGNLSLEGLAYLLAARRNEVNEKLRRFHASESAKLQKSMGADAIAQQIETEYKLAEDDDQEVIEIEQTRAQIQSEPLWHAFFHEAEGLAEADKTILLFNTIIKAGVADRCCMIFEKSRQLYLKCQMDKSGMEKDYAAPININNLIHLPRKMIRYAARTQLEIIITDRSLNPLFENDEYVAQNPDVCMVCIPMLNCGVLIGVLYLEKRTPVSDASISEIKTLLPTIVTSQSTIKDITIKDLFVPVKRPRILSGRETDIVILLSEGLSNEQMAERLGLSIGTVKKHMSSVMTKLNADNRIMALIKAKELKII